VFHRDDEKEVPAAAAGPASAAAKHINAAAAAAHLRIASPCPNLRSSYAQRGIGAPLHGQDARLTGRSAPQCVRGVTRRGEANPLVPGKMLQILHD
jgi:hypothetical protein